ncbi:MAG: hypothetical protein Kow00109_16810 [Acidobacteriota bacterium]
MRSFISSLRFDRLRKLFAGEGEAAPPEPGEPRFLDVQEGLVLLESMVSDGLVYCDGGGRGANGLKTSLLGTNAFGRTVRSRPAGSVAESLAAAAGLGMNGRRTAVFVPGDQLAEGFAQLQTLAARHVPLVVHASLREGFGAGSSHALYHGASDLGLFQVMPHTVQQALDFTVLAHWLAERALLPGLVAFDRRIGEDARFPTSHLVRELLQDPAGEISSLTPAQLLVFGGDRPVVPAWFDLDRPLALGTLQGSNEGASAAVGREVFFAGHVPELLRDGFELLARQTGRRWDLVTTEGMEDADTVVVVQGTAYETVRAAAQYLRQEKKWKVGVLGVTWLRPFPGEALRKLLSGRRRVAVLESSPAAFSEEGPLMREIRRAVPDQAGRWVTGVYGLHGQVLSVGQVVALLEELHQKEGRSKVWLGIVSGPDKRGHYPKRTALIQAVESDYPRLAGAVLSATEVEKIAAEGIRCVQYLGAADGDPAEIAEQLKELVSGKGRGKTRTMIWYPEPGVVSVRAAAGPSELALAEAGLAVDLLLVGKAGLDVLHNPLADVKQGRSVVIQSNRAGSEIWRLIPAFWRSEVQRLRLRLYRTEGGFAELLGIAGKLLEGLDVSQDAVEIDWRDWGAVDDTPEEVPALIRRAGEGDQQFLSPARFWGEIMQPKRAGISDNFPDPILTLGAVPPYTAALARPRGTAQPSLPVLNPEKCTACGHCWPVCPDSAIGASLLGIQEFLDAALAASGKEGKVAGAVKRAHRNVAARLASRLLETKARTVGEGLLHEAYDYVLGRMSIPEGEQRQYRETVAAVVTAAAAISPVASEVFFYEAEAALKGSGRLLFLAFNPNACQGCRLCITSCPEDALEAFDRAGSAGADAREAWRFWENLPDTPGVVIDQAEAKLELGLVASRLLSRHAALVQAVGSFGEPGSGERLAARLVAATVESRAQQRLARFAEKADELAGKTRELLQSLLAEGLTKADPAAVEQALLDLPRRRVSLGELSERLARFGKQVVVDPAKTVRVAQVVQELQDEVWKIRQGPNNLGRARFGLVIVSDRAARWAGRYPNHPYNAPLVVEPTPEGLALAAGVIDAVVEKHLDRVRLVRRAELYLENPPDLPGRLAALAELGWEDLSEAERAACPPVLVLVDEAAMERQAFGMVSRLVGGTLPVKLVLLDGRGVRPADGEPALWALGLGRSWVASTSLGYLEHLGKAVDGAVEYPGPALIHVHVPIPAEHGFETNLTLQRAREAVQARVHPLFVYDPRRPGVLGARLTLEGNPAPREEYAGLDPVQWLAGENRFASLFEDRREGAGDGVDWPEYVELAPEDRAGKVPVVRLSDGRERAVAAPAVVWAAQRRRTWQVLQEMGGVVSPFVEQLRSELEKEVASRNRAEFERMKAEYEARIAELEEGFEARMAEVLRRRLLALAGFAEVTSETEER